MAADKRTVIRRAAKYVIGDMIQTSLSIGEDFSHEAAAYGITIDELDKELLRQSEIMIEKGLR
jgi:hypothetical protein